MNKIRPLLPKFTTHILYKLESNFLRQDTDQYNRYVPRWVYASDVLVEWLDGSVAVVVCDGENQHVAVCPVDRPGSPVILQLLQVIG